MKSNILQQLLFYLLWLCPLYVAWAQPCSQILQQVESQYEEGHIFTIPQVLESCTQSGGFTKEEEIRALKLKALAHIFIDSVGAAEAAMVEFLNMMPEYQIDPVSDPKEFIYLHSKFRTKPIFRIRISVAPNYTLVNERVAFGVENVLEELETSQPSVSFGASVEIEREVFDHMEIASGLQLSLRNFGLQNPIFDYATYDISETQTSIEIPLQLRFLFLTRRRSQPYLSLGWGPSFLLSSTLTGNRQGGQTQNLSAQELRSNGLRNFFNHYALIGAGIRVRSLSRKSFWFTELAYHHILNNMSNPANRYTESLHTLPFKFGYVDNDFSLGMIQLKIGYIYSRYSPKKIEK